MTAGGPTSVVPKLRFPEFWETPAWSIEPLGRLFRERQETDFLNLPLLSVTDRHGVIPQEETNRSNTSNSNKEKYLRVLPGDIAYNTMRMWEGRSARVGIEGLVSPAYTVCRPNVNTNSHFFAYYFKTHSAIEQFRKYSQGLVNDTLNLKYDALSRIPFAFPAPNEQKKIADCLGSLDDLIAAEARKLEALRKHKSGLMQQLFPQEGETVPRLRFPEFRYAVEWEEMRIGDLRPFVTSGSRGWAAFYAPHGSLFVRITNLSRESIDLNLTDSKYVELPEGTSESLRTTLRFDDVLISITADIGIIGYIDADTPSPAYINQHIALVRFSTPKVCGKFVAYFLASEAAQRRFRSVTDNGAKAGMNLMGVQAMSLLLPPPREQQRIAGCLTSLDASLARQIRKLDVLKKHKQGLLQQLFPSVEEESP